MALAAVTQRMIGTSLRGSGPPPPARCGHRRDWRRRADGRWRTAPRAAGPAARSRGAAAAPSPHRARRHGKGHDQAFQEGERRRVRIAGDEGFGRAGEIVGGAPHLADVRAIDADADRHAIPMRVGDAMNGPRGRRRRPRRPPAGRAGQAQAAAGQPLVALGDLSPAQHAHQPPDPVIVHRRELPRAPASN